MKALTILLTLIFAFATYAEVINVPDDHETIQGGIDASEDGDTVLVEAGEYVENINFDGKAIVVVGNPDDPSEVIIDGDEERRVITFNHRETNESILSGFTITNGNGGIYCFGASPILTNLIVTGNHAEYAGGGILLINSGSTILTHSIIHNNIAGDEGDGLAGGISCHGNISMSHVVIRDNSSAGSGGGLAFDHNRSVLDNVLIINNTALASAALVVEDCDELTLNRVTISGNTSENDDYGNIHLYMLGDRGEVHFVNTIIQDNTPPTTRVGVDDGSISLSISFSDIENGEESISIGMGAELNWGDGNIDEDPLFVDADEGDYALTEDSPCIDTGDPDSPEDPDGTRADMGAYYFHQREIEADPLELDFDLLYATQETQDLTFTVRNLGQQVLNVESVIAEGDYFSVDNGDGFELDAEEDQMITVTFAPVDSGHFEGTVTVSSNAVNGDAVVALIGEGRWWLSAEPLDDALPTNFSINAIHPNPFNAQTRLNYSIPVVSSLSLDVYNSSGQLVTTLLTAFSLRGIIRYCGMLKICRQASISYGWSQSDSVRLAEDCAGEIKREILHFVQNDN